MSFAPIALFVYNRPAHTRQTVEALQKNALVQDSDLIIYSDAPKKPEAVEAVREVRAYIRQITGFKSVKIVERDKNWGLANSIIDGVTSVVNEYGRIIVLEDDLVTSPHFLDFMNRALDKYEYEPQVIQVSGYMFPVKLEIEEDALFLPHPTSWGWATWQRAWQLFDAGAKGYAQVRADATLRKRFNLNGAYDYYSMLEDQLAGRVDSWAIRWYLSIFLFDGLVLYPQRSMIANVGFDGSGVHCSSEEYRFIHQNNRAIDLIVEDFPSHVKVSRAWPAIRQAAFQNVTLFQNVKIMKKKIRQQLKAIVLAINSYLKNIYAYLKISRFIRSGMKPWSGGYSEYKSKRIGEILAQNNFDSNQLPEGYGYRLDERVIEYPWFFSRCPRGAGVLLDAGSVLNYANIQAHPSLKTKKIFISTLAPEACCFWRSAVSYVFEDLRSSCFRDNYFDWIVSLSTIEHIGLDNTMLYTDDVSKKENCSSSYMAAVMEYHRMLKPGGVLYLSFPFGKHVNRKWFQIFDGAMVDEIISAFNPEKMEQFYFKYESAGWKSSTREETKNATYFDINTQPEYDADYAAASRAIVCLELVK